MNIKVVIKELMGKEARGVCSVYQDGKEIIHEYFISGPWGKGYLPIGMYDVVYATLSIQDPFKRCGFGWVASLQPRFKTDRTQLAIHPDGGQYIGTLGCVGLQFMTNAFNKKFYEIIQLGLIKGVIPTEVLDGRS